MNSVKLGLNNNFSLKRSLLLGGFVLTHAPGQSGMDRA